MPTKVTNAAATSGGTVICRRVRTHRMMITIPAEPPDDAAAVDWFAGLLDTSGLGDVTGAVSIVAGTDVAPVTVALILFPFI
jgi:hypothetical protein